MTLTALGDIAEFRGGGTPDKSVAAYWGGDIPWASVKDFKSTTLDQTTDFITHEGVRNSATNIIPAGTIVVPTRMAVGKAAITSVDMAINQDLKAVFPKRDLSTRFLLQALLASSSELERRASGATVKGITLDVLRGLKIYLPPLPEQKRIAAILDRADEVCRLRREALARLSDLGQAIFFEMFGDPSRNPLGWDKVPLVDCVAEKDDIRCGPFGTQLLKEEFRHEGVPLWGIKQVNRGFLVMTEEFVSKKKAQELGNYDILPGDIVMTRKGTVGNCSVYPDGYVPGIMHSDLLRVRLNREVADPEFISDQLHWSPDIEHQISLISSGAIMQGINVGKLKQISVLRPPIEIQMDYKAKKSALRGHVATAVKHMEALDALFASLQHRAFRGEL